MEQITVKIVNQKKDCSYPILIGSGLLAELPKLLDLQIYSSFFLITEECLLHPYAEQLKTAFQAANKEIQVVIIKTGEANKTLSNAEQLWQQLLSLGADRKSCLLNLGGGMVGDLAGFAAANYMRGIDFIQLPSTLLAQVDASVGGKLAVNLAGVKNIIGSFQQPQAVVIDLITLRSLPKKEFSAGLAEIIKHALIADYDYLCWLENANLQQLNLAEQTFMIKRSCEIKAAIVSADEKELGERKLLNFGHTAGHAYESLAMSTDQPLLHGEAIALGMLFESQLTKALGMISEHDYERIKNLIVRAELPVRPTLEVSEEAFFELLKKDKKNSNDIINWTLLSALGTGNINQQVEYNEIKRVFQSFR